MPRAQNGHIQNKNSLSRSASSERLEMSNLDDELEPSDDDEADEGDDGESALLGPQRMKHARNKARAQSTWDFVRGILIETAPTLLLTTVGLTFTGELLEQVAQWEALERVDELYILIPMLNNLKGNLEMNLSSRLSTAAVLGELDVLATRRMLLIGTLSLLQVQALVVSAIAALLSFLLGMIISPAAAPQPSIQTGTSVGRRRSPFRKPPSRPDKAQSGIREFGVILCTAMASASLSGLILGSFMCSLILICRRFRRNPDNIAPPIASCLGDLLTLCIMGLVSSVLIRIVDTPLPIVIVILLVMGAVAAVWLTMRNEYARELIGSGWTPLFGAMLISSGSGMVLDHFVNQYEGFGLLAIAISGLPDAVGSIFVSRLSTSLHASASNPVHPDGRSTHEPRALATTVTLFLVTLPVQLLYVTFLHATGWMSLPFLFVVIFVFFFSCAVLTALSIARLVTNFLWRRDLDPDTYAMPIQSSLVDLTGQLMLVACYELAQALGADVKNKHRNIDFAI